MRHAMVVRQWHRVRTERVLPLPCLSYCLCCETMTVPHSLKVTQTCREFPQSPKWGSQYCICHKGEPYTVCFLSGRGVGSLTSSWLFLSGPLKGTTGEITFSNGKDLIVRISISWPYLNRWWQHGTVTDPLKGTTGESTVSHGKTLISEISWVPWKGARYESTISLGKASTSKVILYWARSANQLGL